MPESRLEDLLESVEKDVRCGSRVSQIFWQKILPQMRCWEADIWAQLTMVLLENEHRPQPNRRRARSANIDTDRFRLAQHIITARGIPREEGALPLTTQVAHLARILLLQRLELRVEIVARGSRVLDEVQPLDLLDDGAEQDGAGRVAHPGVELAVRLVGSQLVVAEVVARGLGLFAERHHIRRVGEAPVLVRPELARCAHAGLHLVDDQKDVVLASESAQTFEEVG